jgi:SAM-dependent methyltransferase
VGHEPSSRIDLQRVLRWDRAACTRWGAYLTAAESRALQVALGLAQPGTALDVGCGAGRWSQVLREAGWAVVCADIDSEALEFCRRRVPDATFVQMRVDQDDLPAASNSMQLVVVIEVAPLIEQPWFISETARVLSNEGLLVCTYYNSRSLRGFVYRVLRRPYRFYGGPSFAEFQSELLRAGFEIVHSDGLAWCPFGRESNSPLIPLCTALEQRFGLRRLTRLSPFVALVAQRTRTASVP